jgi:toxin ParE1/3/4
LTGYDIVLTRDAESDLEDIYDYIVEYDSQVNADRVLERLIAATYSLRVAPDRGTPVKELRTVGIAEYRQVFFKPYRLIYRVLGSRIIIYMVADGRRDMQSLLSRRMLRA